MFFIENDQFQVLDRSKHSGSCTNNDIHFTSLDHLPGVISFFGRHAAVKYRDTCREVCADTSNGLRSQRDLRNQIENASAFFNDLFRDTEVNFRLTAAGHTEKQELLLPLSIHDSIYRCLLLARSLKLRCTGIGAKVAPYYWPSAIIREFIAVFLTRRFLIWSLIGYLVFISPLLFVLIQ